MPNVCLPCNQNVVPYGKKESYPCPTCGGMTTKVSKRLKKASRYLSRLGFRVAAADDSIMAISPTDKVKLILVYVDFCTAYDLKLLSEAVGLPTGFEAWLFRNNETDRLFSRLTYTNDSFPALSLDSSTFQIMMAVIKELEQWAEDLYTSGRNAVLVLSGFYEGLAEDASVKLGLN
jgi:predicted RNA-binding Zn-ribbon protein involved in translation (DUF1610 family)